MLMCFLTICPFIKPVGKNCVVEKRDDQCCPTIKCPQGIIPPMHAMIQVQYNYFLNVILRDSKIFVRKKYTNQPLHFMLIFLST